MKINNYISFFILVLGKYKDVSNNSPKFNIILQILEWLAYLKYVHGVIYSDIIK